MYGIVNSCNIDTIYGNRNINLVKENIDETDADLIVVSSNKINEKNTKNKSNANIEINGVKMHYWTETKEMPAPKYLSVQIPEKNGNYDSNIKGIFASIKALEFNDNDFEDISLPVIGGDLEKDYFEKIKILLKYAVLFLKQSKNTQTINFYITNENEEESWSRAFEKSLGRTYYKQGSIVVIESMITEIQETIDKILKSEDFKELEFTLRTIEKELESVDSLSINSIAINSRKVTEIIVKEIASRKNLNIYKIKYDLSSIINLLASKDILAPWVVQYLHTARVFGNKSAHVETAIKHVPNKFFNSDFISMFSSLYNILLFWYHNKKDI